MRKIYLLLIVFCIFSFYGCSMVASPVTNGMIFTSVKGPVGATSLDSYSAVGTSSCYSVLGLLAVGDASIDAAMRYGGITKIHHVDHQSTSFLGMVAIFETIVYGQ